MKARIKENIGNVEGVDGRDVRKKGGAMETKHMNVGKERKGGRGGKNAGNERRR